MPKRQSIYIRGFAHSNPVPAASRVGNIVISGGLHGSDPETSIVADTLEEQCANIFAHIRAIMELAGGSPDDIIKIDVRMRDPSQRGPLNVEWQKMFPDENARPTRQVVPGDLGEGKALLHCNFMAVLADAND